MPKPAIDFLTFRLDVLSEQAKLRVSRDYESTYQVTLRELRVLRLAYAQPGITQSGVVESSYLEKTLVSKLTTSLVQRQLIRREIGQEDARLVHLYLTDKGKAIVEGCNAIGRQIEKEWLATIDLQDLAVFERVLAQLTANCVEMA